MRKINFTNHAQDTRKKAEMSLTVVVSAVIALVVLIVLIFIFTKNIGGGSKTLSGCEINGGSCLSGASSCPGGSFPIVGTCADTSAKCCSADLLCEKDPATGKCK